MKVKWVFIIILGVLCVWMASGAIRAQGSSDSGSIIPPAFQQPQPDKARQIDMSPTITTTTSILSDAPDPSLVSQPFTVTFGVTSTLDIPTGVVTVTVSDSAEECSGLLVVGQGGCQVALSTPGTYTLTATYAGEGDFQPSSGSELHTVTAIPAITTTIDILSDDPDPSLVSQPFTVTFGVTSTMGIPTGVVTVTVSESSEACGAELVDGLGACQIALSAPGTFTLNAAYAGEGDFLPSSASEQHTVDLRRVYLPMVIRPPEVVPGLTGKVTMNGVPIGGISLDLRFYDGSSFSTAASTTTGPDGNYLFSGVPALQPGQFYYVRYPNNEEENTRLSLWLTAENTTYNAQSLETFATFDIANIVLSTPDPGANVDLPVTFNWIPRPASPTDSYGFDLFDPANNDLEFYTDPPLGYVSSYTLEDLPDGFNKGVEYGWAIIVNSPEGGYGGSYYYHSITFK